MNPSNGKRREETFRRLMAARGVPLERPSRLFRFNRTQYRPDWYSPSEGIYYEVLGSRQRAHTISALLDLMELIYPAETIRPVTPDGQVVEWKKDRRLAGLRALPHGDELIRVLQDSGQTMADFARSCGVDPAYFSILLHGRRPMTTRTRERVLASIERHLAVIRANGHSTVPLFAEAAR